MAPRILLHIGANKTGSTAIQDFLLLNAEQLRALGHVVAPSDLLPEGRVTGRHVPLIKALLLQRETGRRVLETRLLRLLEALEADQQLILSAENLALSSHDRPGSAATLNGAQELFAGLAQRTEIRLLLYIRRQDEFLLSSWQQWEGKLTPDFWAWMLSAAGIEGDWRAVLSAWEQVVPRQNIQVRLYDRAAFPGGDIIADFAEATGLAHHLPELRRPPRDSNPGYSDAVTAFAGANPLLFPTPHDHQFARTLAALTGSCFRRRPRESRITHAQRSALLGRYEEANEWVRRAYFPGRAAPLFTPPTPGDYDGPSASSMEAGKWDVAASLIHGLAKRLKP